MMSAAIVPPSRRRWPAVAVGFGLLAAVVVAGGRGLASSPGAAAAALAAPQTPQTPETLETLETPETPEAAVRAFYAALAEGDCQRAARLRQPYTVGRCRAIRDVAVAAIVQRYADERTGVVFVEVTYRTGAADQSRYEAFRGFVKAVRGAEHWRIDGRSYRPWADTALDRYLREIAGISRGHGAQAVTMALPPAPQRDRSGATPRPAPPPVGSAAVLAGLWPTPALQGFPEEARPRSLKPADRTPPARTVASPALDPLPPALHGSIRRVRPAEGDAPIALTFDLCEQAHEIAGYDGAIVDYLRAERVAATFFAGGKWLRSHQERAMQLIADPLFEVGNPAWTHGNLRVLDAARAEEQIVWTQQQYAEVHAALAARAGAAGIDAAEVAKIPAAPRAFRFPYGACHRESLALANRLGLPSIQWDVVSGDAARATTAAALAKGVLAAARPGSIVVMHANGRGHATAAALPAIVAGLRGRGFRFVTIGELLAAGTPVAVESCYELKPGDNLRYDALAGDGRR